MKMATNMNMNPDAIFQRRALNRMLTAVLSLAILAAAALDPRAIPARASAGTAAASAAQIEAQTSSSSVLHDLQSLRGGIRPPLECAMFFAGLGLGLVAGAVVLAASAGTATPLVMGMAFYGGLLPTAALACY
ncbi:MAG: hypothetical protein ACKVX9_07320 [Blastocatellia bacterium]